MHRRLSLVAAGAALALGLSACGGGGAGGGGGDTSDTAPEDLTIGVSMPTETSERWIADGDNVQSQLEEAGYQVDLQFAGDDIPTQSRQIDTMITDGADALIIAAIDGTALASQLDAAAAEGIPVISYDRLIRDSPDVDFYVTFDNFEVGVAQANALLAGLGLQDEEGNPTDEQGPFTVELFAGSLDDNNAFFFYEGAMSVLEPLIEDGTLEVGSGQTDIEQIATLRWSQETAQTRMETLITSQYDGGSGRLDGVLSPYDGISRGIITALTNAGYGPTIADGLPVVTGQDAEIASVKLIADDVQSSTIFKDTRLLAEQAVVAARTFLEGEEPEANDTESYDNGEGVVPSFLLPVETVYADTIEPSLVDSGYYTEQEVQRGQVDTP